jgi:type II secretory pathway component PulF
VLDLNESSNGWGQIQIGSRIRPKDLTVFSRQFATMVNSGLSMLRCLYVLEEQTQTKKLAAVITDVRAVSSRHLAVGRSRSTPRSSAGSTSAWSEPASSAGSWTRS